jgi:hypothetical protein
MNRTAWREQVAPPKRGRWLRWVLAAVVVAAGLAVLREATMNRPDPPRSERTSVIELVVHRNDTNLSAAEAADVLVTRCSITVDDHRVAAPTAVESNRDNRFLLTVEPALGHHAQLRLVGCLEDLTVPRILGEVARVDHR